MTDQELDQETAEELDRATHNELAYTSAKTHRNEDISDHNAQVALWRTVAAQTFAEVGDDRQRAYLTSLALTGISVKSCGLAGIKVSTISSWSSSKDTNFRGYQDVARAMHADMIEDTLYRRVHEGTPSPVYYRGEKVGEERKYSDNLLMFSLKGAKPQKYAERREVYGEGGGAIRVENVHDSMLSRERLLVEIASEMNRLIAASAAPVTEVLEVPVKKPHETSVFDD